MNIRGTKRILGRTVAASFSLILITSGIVHATAEARDYAHVRRVNNGMGRICDFNEKFAPIPECRNSDHPQLLVWGDSYAMHLVPGLLGNAAGAPAMVQATRSACGPLLGISVVEIEKKNGYDQAWAKNCIAFNESVLAYLAQEASITTVALSTPFQSVFSKEQFQVLKKDAQDGSYHLIEASMTEAGEALKKTVVAIRALGKRVVVVAPPPATRFNIGRCTERLESGLLVWRQLVFPANQIDAGQTAHDRGRGRVQNQPQILSQGAR